MDRHGYTGKMLKVDLGARTASTVELDAADLAAYVGGRGLGVRLLTKHGRHLLDPLAAEAALVIATGPLTGTRAPGSGRLSLSALSPLTDTLFDSNSGGFFGPRLKGAGFDVLWIEGASETPVALVIDAAGVRFEDADDLWGKGNFATRAALKEKYGAAYATLTIGQAGESGMLMANVAHGERFFGRGGLGAVFGAKKLKAVAVAGKYKPSAADAEGFDFIVNEARKLISANPITSKGLPQFGTPVMMNVMNSMEALPVGNFRKNSFGGASAISGEALRDRMVSGRHSCPGCPIGCGRKVSVDGEELEGPEFETLWSFGAALEIDDLEGIARINRLANDLGLDTVSAGSTVAAARELYEKGLLGFDPLAGGLEGVAKLLREAVEATGNGAELRDGSRRLARMHEAPEASMSVKGLEMPAYDPRGCKGQGLAYATSNRGGCHLRAYMIAPEILATPKQVNRFASSGKAGLVIVSQNLNAAVDSLVMCRFTSFALKDDYYARLLSAMVGARYHAQELMEVGERIYNAERLANIARGFGRSDDLLPRRLVEECAEEGVGKGQCVELDSMLDEYYRFRGWDNEGSPKPEKLARLGIGRDLR